MDAAIATKAYLHGRSKGGPENRDKEHHLAALWQSAATAIAEYDHQLFDSSRIKALGWSDPSEWRRVKGREWTVKMTILLSSVTGYGGMAN